MPSDLFSIVITAGVLIQAIGLCIVIYQLSRMNLSIRVSAQTALYQQASDARSYLVEYPELRKYFFDGVPADPDAPHYDRVKTVAELFLNYLEHLLLQQSTLRKSDWTAWQTFVQQTVRNSPILQELIRHPHASYSRELTALCDEILSEATDTLKA